MPEYKTKNAFWDLTNQELNAAYQPQVDDFGVTFVPRLIDDLPCYFALQRADDPGMFHYSE